MNYFYKNNVIVMLRGRGVDFVTFSESVMIRLHMSCTEKV